MRRAVGWWTRGAASRGGCRRFSSRARGGASGPEAAPKAVLETHFGKDFDYVTALLRRHSRRTWGNIAMIGGAVVGGVALTWNTVWKDKIAEEGGDITAKSIQSAEAQLDASARRIVGNMLHDEKILRDATDLLAKAIQLPQTQEAAQRLVQRLLADEGTRASIEEMAGNIVGRLLRDPETNKLVVRTLADAITDPQQQQALSRLFSSWFKNPETQQLLQDAGARVSVRTLSDADVKRAALLLMMDVMADEAMRERSGDYLWGSIKSAMTPSILGRSSDPPPAAQQRQQQQQQEEEEEIDTTVVLPEAR